MDLTIALAVAASVLVVLGCIVGVYAVVFLLLFCTLELISVYEVGWPPVPGTPDALAQHPHRINASMALVAPLMVLWWVVLMVLGALTLVLRAYAAPTTYMIQSARGQGHLGNSADAHQLDP